MNVVYGHTLTHNHIHTCRLTHTYTHTHTNTLHGYIFCGNMINEPFDTHETHHTDRHFHPHNSHSSVLLFMQTKSKLLEKSTMFTCKSGTFFLMAFTVNKAHLSHPPRL